MMECAGHATYPPGEVEHVRHWVTRLLDEHRLRLWFAEWDGVPGQNNDRRLAEGIATGPCVVLFVGAEPLEEWIPEEVSAVIQRRKDDDSFGVITVLLPGCRRNLIPEWLLSRGPIDFRDEAREAHEYHRLVCGLLKKSPGRWPVPASPPAREDSELLIAQKEIRRLDELRKAGLPEDVFNKLCQQIGSGLMRGGEDDNGR